MSVVGLATMVAVGSISPVFAASEPAPGSSECQVNGKPAPKSVAFVVRYVDRHPGGEFVVTFDNGEVWRQVGRNKVLKLERGEQVVIRRSKTCKFTLWSRSGESTLVQRMH
jgi:hypothetical protein